MKIMGAGYGGVKGDNGKPGGTKEKSKGSWDCIALRRLGSKGLLVFTAEG